MPHALADVSHLNEEICHIVSAGGDYRMTSNYMSKLGSSDVERSNGSAVCVNAKLRVTISRRAVQR